MDKTKRSPIPDKTTAKDGAKHDDKSVREPQFIRGTIEPTTKKER